MKPSMASVQELRAKQTTDFILLAYFTLLHPSGFTRIEIYALLDVGKSEGAEWVRPLLGGPVGGGGLHREGEINHFETENSIQRLIYTGLLGLYPGETYIRHFVNNHFKVKEGVCELVRHEISASHQGADLARLTVETVTHMHRVIAKNTAARRHMKTTWDYAVEVPSCFPTVRPDAFMHFALGLYDEKEFKYVVQVAERASLQYNDESPDRLPEWDGFRTEGNLEKMKTLLASCYHILARNTSTDLMQEANLLNPDSTTRIWREDEYQNMRDPVGLYQRLMCYMSEIEAATWRLKNDLTRRDF